MNNDLLNDRTCNIIFLCKKFNYVDEVKTAIAEYMSEECCCDIAEYTEDAIFNILCTAIFDFLHHANKHSIISFTYDFINAHYIKLIDCMIVALRMTQVREQLGYEYVDINGWHKTDFIQRFDI
jgi:hypothetical protein